MNTRTQGSPAAAACAGRPSTAERARSNVVVVLAVHWPVVRAWSECCACARRRGARAQGRNSRVLLRHATKEVYEELAAPTLTDPVHIFPGAIGSACWPRQAALCPPSDPLTCDRADQASALRRCATQRSTLFTVRARSLTGTPAFLSWRGAHASRSALCCMHAFAVPRHPGHGIWLLSCGLRQD
jgi:hypothetical protein